MREQKLARLLSEERRGMHPEAQHWFETARELGRLIERPFHYVLALTSPIWGAIATASDSAPGVMFFGGMGAVCFLLGVAGLSGMLEKPKPAPLPPAVEVQLQALSELRDAAIEDVERWLELRDRIEERQR